MDSVSAEQVRASFRRAWHGSADVAIPLLLALVAIVEMVSLDVAGRPYGATLELTSATLLVWRRRAPVVIPTLAFLLLIAMPLVGPQLDEVTAPILFLSVASYTMGRWRADLRGLLGIGLVLGALWAVYAFVDTRAHSLGDVLFVLTLVLPPYVAGRLVRRLEDRNELLQRNQELIRREAAHSERERIARELHDVIAHSVSAMVVQTAAAQDLVRSDPSRADQVLADVAATGRQALAETGWLLHVLRDAGDELGLSPVPGLAQVHELVAEFRASGLDVELQIDDQLPVLGAGVDVSAYRIVQEALTNALKYGADRTAALSLKGRWQRSRDHRDEPERRGDGQRQRTRSARNGRTGLPARWDARARSDRRRILRGARDTSGGEPMTRVVIADDQDLIRSGLELVLQARGVEVVGQAADGRQAVDLVRREQPDVVLMDIRMPVLDGIAATREITGSGSPTRVLVLTTYDLDSYVYGALKAGASGFLLKATPPDRLTDGIRVVAAGEALLAPSLTRRLIEEHVRGPAPGMESVDELARLTERELEVFSLVARGLSNDEIAQSLVLSTATVKTHLNRILSKLERRTRVQLVVLAYESGRVRPGQTAH